MEAFLRRLMERRVKVDLYINGVGWLYAVTIRNVNNQFVEMMPQKQSTLLWQLSSIYGAREAMPVPPEGENKAELLDGGSEAPDLASSTVRP